MSDDTTTAPATVAPLLLTPREAARALRVCEKTLWTLTHPRGPIPVVRIGRSVRYSRDALVQWIADQAAACGPQAQANGGPTR